MASFRDTHFVLQKCTNPQSKRFGVHKTCTELCGTVDVWNVVSLQTFILGLYRVNTLQAKGTEKCKILDNLLDKEVENFEDHGCPKDQDLVEEESWICSYYSFRHKTTLHSESVKQNCLVTR